MHIHKILNTLSRIIPPWFVLDKCVAQEREWTVTPPPPRVPPKNTHTQTTKTQSELLWDCATERFCLLLVAVVFVCCLLGFCCCCCCCFVCKCKRVFKKKRVKIERLDSGFIACECHGLYVTKLFCQTSRRRDKEMSVGLFICNTHFQCCVKGKM